MDEPLQRVDVAGVPDVGGGELTLERGQDRPHFSRTLPGKHKHVQPFVGHGAVVNLTVEIRISPFSCPC